MSRHTSARGGARAATSSTKKALDRAAGLAATLDACGSKVRSPYKGTDKHNRWETKDSIGEMPGDKVRGYGNQSY